MIYVKCCQMKLRLDEHEKWKAMGNCDRNDSFFLEIPHHLSSTEWYFCQSLYLFWAGAVKIKLKIRSRFNQSWRDFCFYFFYVNDWRAHQTRFISFFENFFLNLFSCIEKNRGNILSAFLKVTAWHRIQITLVMHTHRKSDMEDECETNRKKYFILK